MVQVISVISDAIFDAISTFLRQIYSAKYAMMTQFGHKFYEDTNSTLHMYLSPKENPKATSFHGFIMGGFIKHKNEATTYLAALW